MIKCSGCDHISLIGHALGGKVYLLGSLLLIP